MRSVPFSCLLSIALLAFVGCEADENGESTSRLRCDRDSACGSGRCVAGYCSPEVPPGDSGSNVADAGRPIPADSGPVDAGSDASCERNCGSALSWFTTCGDPVCGLPPRPSTLPSCSRDMENEPCSEAGVQCALNDGCGTNLICAESDPKLGLGGCPISRRRYKTDIDYLTEAETTRAHDELMSIQLATYRYRAGDARQHLGFIMEDVEPSLSVDSTRGIVDLYGYASLAVAALQAQNRRIEALEREVEAVRTADGPICR